MRLLKVKVDGAELFKNCLFELDFITTDRVPRDDEGDVYKRQYGPRPLRLEDRTHLFRVDLGQAQQRRGLGFNVADMLLPQVHVVPQMCIRDRTTTFRGRRSKRASPSQTATRAFFAATRAASRA